MSVTYFSSPLSGVHRTSFLSRRVAFTVSVTDPPPLSPWKSEIHSFDERPLLLNVVTVPVVGVNDQYAPETSVYGRFPCFDPIQQQRHDV